MQNKDLRKLYSPPNIIRLTKSRRMGWVGHVTKIQAPRSAFRILMGKSEGKNPLGRSRCR
jgi:hypothetical protein